MSDVKRVVLAYSGGLDTSVILKWLKETYACEVVTFTADLGQGEELAPARRKAELMGVRPEHIFIDDLREEFVGDYVMPIMRANALYEGLYLLGTSIARPLIAKRQIEIARQVSADAVSHGATGKGNDQVRFELGYYALAPDIRVIAPWREWDLTSRSKLIEFAEQHQIPVAKDKRGEAPFSVDANLLHTSSEGLVLEDPWAEVPDYVFSRTANPEDAPDAPQHVTVDFERGDAVAVDGEALSPAALLTKLNELGRTHGIGRLDLVENRFVGMKSRGMYETPGGTIYHLAHRGIEQLTLDRGAAHLKDELAPRYAELIYNGFWFSPEREMLQAAIDHSQAKVTGTVRLKLYKGGVHVVGRKSPNSLYSEKVVTFEDDQGAYDQRDAAGFIRLNALRLRLLGRRDNHSDEEGDMMDEAIKAAIEAMLRRQETAWDAGDAEGFAADVTDDVVFTNVVGMFSVGRAPFVAQHAHIFATFYKGSRMRQELVHVTMVGEDAAIVDTLTEGTGFQHLPPGAVAIDGKLHTRLEQVMVRRGDGWRVQAFHNVVVQPLPGAAGRPDA